MSDINTVVLTGRLTADAVIAPKKGFVAVRMRIATTRFSGGKDKTIFNNVETTLGEDKTAQIALWTARCIKGARIAVHGRLDVAEITLQDGSQRQVPFIKCKPQDVALPEAAKAASSTATGGQPRESATKLARRDDVLKF